ncbi:MAG: PD40 domain-containing protein [Fimbriimonadia bacterium]
MKRAFLLVALAASAAQSQAWVTERVSISYAGTEGNGASTYASVSGDGRFVAFHSSAWNLVPDDTNGTTDVFVRNTVAGTTERISVSSTGTQANGLCNYPAISADGRYVAFRSSASNLVSGDTNGIRDIFVRDRLLGTTERVSLSSAGAQANGDSDFPAISSDGRYVAFESAATNLVTNDTNDRLDVFVHDRLTGATERVSLTSAGSQGNRGSMRASISADGRFVAFHSYATNLVPDDTNGAIDVFVRDRLNGTTERVSVSSGGVQGNGDSMNAAISADGSTVAFQSDAWTLTNGDTNAVQDVFVRDRLSGTTHLVSVSSLGAQGNGGSLGASVSGDGRFVAFHSAASNLVPGDDNAHQDVFLYDRSNGTTQMLTTSPDGLPGNHDSKAPALSGDGRSVVFESLASNLVEDDTNGQWDVFITRADGAPEITISGTVRFMHLSGQAPIPPSVEIRVALDGGSPYYQLISLGPTGTFALTVPAGTQTCTLSVKHTHWLRRTVPVDTSIGNVQNVEMVLPNGDANPDNGVDLLDLNRILNLFGRQDALADLDEDGVVGISDLNIVLVGFGTHGDP